MKRERRGGTGPGRSFIKNEEGDKEERQEAQEKPGESEGKEFMI